MFPALRTKKTNTPRRSDICRRDGVREKLAPVSITCWSQFDAPTKVAAIEADSKGARLMLPWSVSPGENITVSLADELGQYQTHIARVVWTQPLQLTGRVVAGVAFSCEAA